MSARRVSTGSTLDGNSTGRSAKASSSATKGGNVTSRRATSDTEGRSPPIHIAKGTAPALKTRKLPS